MNNFKAIIIFIIMTGFLTANTCGKCRHSSPLRLSSSNSENEVRLIGAENEFAFSNTGAAVVTAGSCNKCDGSERCHVCGRGGRINDRDCCICSGTGRCYFCGGNGDLWK